MPSVGSSVLKTETIPAPLYLKSIPAAEDANPPNKVSNLASKTIVTERNEILHDHPLPVIPSKNMVGMQAKYLGSLMNRLEIGHVQRSQSRINAHQVLALVYALTSYFRRNMSSTSVR